MPAPDAGVKFQTSFPVAAEIAVRLFGKLFVLSTSEYIVLPSGDIASDTGIVLLPKIVLAAT
jgi:hypothetical protein